MYFFLFLCNVLVPRNDGQDEVHTGKTRHHGEARFNVVQLGLSLCITGAFLLSALALFLLERIHVCSQQHSVFLQAEEWVKEGQRRGVGSQNSARMWDERFQGDKKRAEFSARCKLGQIGSSATCFPCTITHICKLVQLINSDLRKRCIVAQKVSENVKRRKAEEQRRAKAGRKRKKERKKARMNE